MAACYIRHAFHGYTNSVLTELESWILLMVSPKSSAMESSTILEQAAPASLSGIVLVITRLSMGASVILEMAGPDRMGWVQHA
jgi:hypothetical protein